LTAKIFVLYLSKVAHKSVAVPPPHAVPRLIGSYTDGLQSVDDPVMCHPVVRRMREIWTFICDVYVREDDCFLVCDAA
jgi:hypothetical protein